MGQAVFSFVSEEARAKVEGKLAALKPLKKSKFRAAKVSPFARQGEARLTSPAEPTPKGRLVTVVIHYLSEGGEQLACQSEPMTRSMATKLTGSLNFAARGCSAWIVSPGGPPLTFPAGVRFVKLPSQGPAPVLVEQELEAAPMLLAA